MLQLLLAAPSSGSGKTTAACALLSALKARGLEPCAFKCGPDYIDPMFHRAVLGVPSHNLDLFFSTPQTVRRLYTGGAAGHGSAVCEGAMGYYDGLGGVSATASAWHTADVLDLPVLLVVRPKAMFTTCYANVPEEIEEEFLSKYSDFVRNLYDNTVTVNRIFTGMRNRRSLLM